MVALLLILTTVGIIAFRSQSLEFAVGRIGSLFDKSELVKSTRFIIWSTSLDMWAKSPIWGVGFGDFQYSSGLEFRQSHNILMECLCELGLLGLVSLLALLVVPLAQISKAMQSKSAVPVATASLLIFALTCACFSGDISENRLIFAFAALLIAESRLIRRWSNPRIDETVLEQTVSPAQSDPTAQ